MRQPEPNPLGLVIKVAVVAAVAAFAGSFLLTKELDHRDNRISAEQSAAVSRNLDRAVLSAATGQSYEAEPFPYDPVPAWPVRHPRTTALAAAGGAALLVLIVGPLLVLASRAGAPAAAGLGTGGAGVAAEGRLIGAAPSPRRARDPYGSGGRD
jgi:hypothetical protein